MKQTFYVYNKENKPTSVTIRTYQKEDIPQLIDIQKEAFPPPFPSDLWWNDEQLTNHITKFPEGALCVEIDKQLVGSMTGLVVNIEKDTVHHTWEEITDSGYIGNHNPNGNTLYIVDISVRPSFRSLGLGKLLMQSMYHVVVKENIPRLLGGGRMSGYHRYSSTINAETYLNEVVKGNIHDPVISFLLRCGRTPIGVMENYLEDEESCNYAALMEWRNPFL